MDKDKNKVLTETDKDNKDAYLRGVKTQKKSSLIVLIISIVLSLGIGGGVGYVITANIMNKSSGLSEEYRLVKKQLESKWLYKDKYEDMEPVFEDLMVKGNLSNYNDPYTQYASSLEDMGLTSSWTGIYGYSSSPYYAHDNKENKDYGGMRISSLQDGNMYKAGAEVGDVIIAFKQYNDSSYTYVENIAPADLTDKMKPSETGKDVTFLILRNGEEVEISATTGSCSKVVVTKEDYTVASSTLVLRIDSFYGTNGTSARDAVKSYIDDFIDQNGKVEKLILDCTSNGGGYTYDGYMTASMFLSSGSLIYTTRDYQENILSSYYQKGSYYTTDQVENIGIILNSGSASATELFTNALKDNNRAKVYGTKSYGKGVEQTTMDISSSLGKKYGSLKITTDKVYTPSGNCIHGTGITPDLLTATGDNDYYSYTSGLVYYPYQEDSYRLTYTQEQSILSCLNKLDAYKNYTSFKDALTKFQEDHDLTVTGEYDSPTLYRLYGEMLNKYYQGKQTEVSLVESDL